MRRRGLIITIIAVLVLGLGTLAAVMLFGPKSQTNTTTEEPAVKKAITITNAGGHRDIMSAEIETQVQLKITSQLPVNDNSYAAAIRESSIERAQVDTGTHITYLIDIPAQKRTYRISLGQDPSTGESSVYVVCPDKADLLYGEFACTNE